MRYGFVGLGHLGRHLAANLARGGFELGVFDLDRSAARRALEAGATWSPSVADLARASDALITCLPSPAASDRGPRRRPCPPCAAAAPGSR